MSLERLQHWAKLVVLPLVSAATTYTAIASLPNPQLDALQAQQARLDQELALEQTLAWDWAGAKARQKAAEQELMRTIPLDPYDFARDEWLRQTYDLAKKSGVTLSVPVDQGDVVHEIYREASYRFEITGSYPAVTSFLGKLATLRTWVIVPQIHLAMPKAGSRDGQAHGEIVANYIRIGPRSRN
jgi:Tfp pilus assembly protein PilO